MFSNEFYRQFHRDVHSQNGEDGIIEELLRRLNISNGWVCEFGAWDGIHLSNTFHLVEQGFRAVYIEGHADRYKDLLKTCARTEGIIPVQAYVDHCEGSTNTLDKLLGQTPIPTDFDVLSIDIDSYDYQVWESLKLYRPKMVIIEINSSVPPNQKDYIHEPGRCDGSGFRSTYELGLRKGYTFVLHTGNMFFIRNDLATEINFEFGHPFNNFRTNWMSEDAVKKFNRS